jgi:hypothetical protein
VPEFSVQEYLEVLTVADTAELCNSIVPVVYHGEGAVVIQRLLDGKLP